MSGRGVRNAASVVALTHFGEKVGLLGLRLGDLYLIERSVGRGGFATVRRASHRATEQEVVLKVRLPGTAIWDRVPPRP